MLEDIMNSDLALMIQNTYLVKILSLAISIFMIAIIALLVQYLIKFIVIRVIKFIVLKTKPLLVDVIVNNKSISLISHLGSGIIIWTGSQLLSQQGQSYSLYVSMVMSNLALFYIFIIIVFIVTLLISSVGTYYENKVTFARQHPIYSYLKVINFFVWVISIVLIVSFFINKSPWAFLTGIGAVSAFFLLIFKDTLLGIVSSIQATASDIVRVGDTISIDKSDLEGTVIDISVNTVKIRSGDNTISTVPTYMLTTEIVKNQRWINEFGTRRIKRAIPIDINSITWCDDELLNKLNKFSCLVDYIKEHKDAYITNLELYRVYVENYLFEHIDIVNSKKIMVRHLYSDASGLPLEIYAYVNKVDVIEFEKVQAEIFEHCFSLLSDFNLKIFQLVK